MACADGTGKRRAISLRVVEEIWFCKNRIGFGGVDEDVGTSMPGHIPDTPTVDPGDFALFYEQHYVEAVRLAGFLTSDRALSEELAQEAFLRLQPEFARVRNPGGYLRTTLVNLCRNDRRSSRREVSRRARHGACPTTVLDRSADLDASLRRLSYGERAVVVLRYWLGLSEAEIAEHLDCPPGTVKSRHARALKKIRKELQ